MSVGAMPPCSPKKARGERVAFSRLASHLSPFWVMPPCSPEDTRGRGIWAGITHTAGRRWDGARTDRNIVETVS